MRKVGERSCQKVIEGYHTPNPRPSSGRLQVVFLGIAVWQHFLFRDFMLRSDGELRRKRYTRRAPAVQLRGTKTGLHHEFERIHAVWRFDHHQPLGPSQASRLW